MKMILNRIYTTVFIFTAFFMHAELSWTSELKFSEQILRENFDPYFEIEKFSVKEISISDKGEEFFLETDETPAVPTPEEKPKVEGGVLDSIIMSIEKLIAVGEKIVPIIEKGRPVVNNRPMAMVSVLPRIEGKDIVVHEMEDWSVPRIQHFRASFSNKLGIEVVSFIYSVTYQYGGSLNGKGKYLTGIRASAKNINVSWGFDLEATSELLQISNVGTGGNVVAGATLEISYTVKNMLKVISTYKNYFISGDGKIVALDD